MRTAVLTRVLIASEDRSSRHGTATNIWHFHHVQQPNDGGLHELEHLGVKHDAVVFEHFSFL
jgi:hypothetical protein